MAADDEEVCVECEKAKAKAEARELSGPGGLQLGDCTPLYRAWADCIKQAKGQASSCTDVMKQFKECHSAAAKSS